jgi:hypothetical protein
MHLRDRQQDKTFALQLYEKGLLSAQTILEVFEYDPDQEIERKNFFPIPLRWTHGQLRESPTVRDIYPNQVAYLDIFNYYFDILWMQAKPDI